VSTVVRTPSPAGLSERERAFYCFRVRTFRFPWRAEVASPLTAYCTVRAKQPGLVVETGVARGVSSRMILAAMDASACGRLVSIDLYKGADSRAAVPERLRGRWQFIPGSSRTHLRGLLAVDTPDLFIHDSQHAYRNMRFDLNHAWNRMRPGGVLVVDDIHENAAFEELLRVTGARAVFGQEQRKAGLLGIAAK
jgi:predicted O-methyltransferase YrrM